MMIKYVLLLVLSAAATVGARPMPFSATKKLVVQIPRGGGVFGTQLTKENLASIFVLQMAINGAIGLPAPDKLLECYGGVASKKGTAEDFFWHFIGSGSMAMAIMSYLSVFTDADASKIAFWGMLPCLYQAWTTLLRGWTRAAGFHQGTGVGLVIAYMPVILLLTGKGNSKLIIKYFAAVAGPYGLVGSFGSKEMIKSVFGVSVDDAPTKTACKWVGRVDLWCSIMLWSLVSDKINAFQALAYINLIYAAQLLDYAYITNDRKGSYPNQSELMPPFLIALAVFLGVGLLLQD